MSQPEINALLRSSRRYLKTAVACEEQGDGASARENYGLAAQTLRFARNIETDAAKRVLYETQIERYVARAEEVGTAHPSLYARAGGAAGQAAANAAHESARLMGSGGSRSERGRRGGGGPARRGGKMPSPSEVLDRVLDVSVASCLETGSSTPNVREHGKMLSTTRHNRVKRIGGVLALAALILYVVLSLNGGRQRLVLKTTQLPVIPPSACLVHQSDVQADEATGGARGSWRKCAMATAHGPPDAVTGGLWTGGDDGHQNVCDFTGTTTVRIVLEDGSLGHIETVTSDGQGVWCSPMTLCPAMFESFDGVEGVGHCEVLETIPGSPYGTSKEVWLKQKLYYDDIGNIPLHNTPPHGDYGSPCPCCCHDGDTCSWKRTTPQDPLKWCIVDRSCPRSTRGDSGHTEAHRGTHVPAWAHCDGDSIFWASNYPARLELAKSDRPIGFMRTTRARVGEFGVAQPPVWSQSGSGLIAALPTTTETRLKEHFIFQTDCPPDGTGTNTHFWRLSLWLALRLNIQLVWNPANFVSENTPQYVRGDTLLTPLSTPPGDVLAAFGFDHVWPSAGMTPTELYMRIADGTVTALMMDDFVDIDEPYISQIQLDELAGAIERRIAAQEPGVTTKPIAVIMQQCAPIYISGLTYEWPPMSDWLSSAYEAGRRRLRPVLQVPPSLSLNGPKQHMIVVHARLGDIDYGQYHESMQRRRSSVGFVETMLKDLLRGSEVTADGWTSPLSCENSAVLITVQIANEGKSRDEMLALPGKFPAGCIELRASHFEVETSEESVRSLFKDLDLLSNADVLVGSPSSLSKFSASLAPPQTIRLLPVTSGEDPTASLPGLRGIHNVLEMCPGGFTDMASLWWMWERRGWVQRDLTRRSMACAREKKRMKHKWWAIDAPNDPLLAAGPLRLSRVVLSSRLARSRQSLRTWDAELMIRMGLNESITMPELTGFAVAAACLPPALVPVELRRNPGVLRRDLARMLGPAMATIGSMQDMEEDRIWGASMAKLRMAPGVGSEPLCCLARWMSSDPYVRLRVMLSLTSRTVADLSEDVLQLPGVPRTEADVDVSALLAAAEVPIEPFHEKGTQVVGELLRWHLEWNILKILSRRLSPHVEFDQLQLLWNDRVGAATVLRGAFDLLTYKWFELIAGNTGCTLRRKYRSVDMDAIYAEVVKRFRNAGLLELPMRAYGRISKYQGAAVKQPHRAIDVYGDRRTEEALWGRWHHGGAEYFDDPKEIAEYAKLGGQQFMKIENRKNQGLERRKQNQARRKKRREARQAGQA